MPNAQRRQWRLYPIVATLCLVTVIFVTLDQALIVSQSREEAAWIRTSRSWLDRRACTWLGACGIQHMFRSPWRSTTLLAESADTPDPRYSNRTGDWIDTDEDPERWDGEERLLREIPQYVLDYAPYVHLYSGEQFWPSDIAEHLVHTTPHLNYTPVEEEWRHPNISNLHHLNRWGRSIFLKSNDNVEDRPSWLGSSYNIPERPRKSPNDVPEGSGENEWFRGKIYPWQADLKKSLEGGEAWLNKGIGDIKYRGGERKNPKGIIPPGQYEVPFEDPLPAPSSGYKAELRKRKRQLKGRQAFRAQWEPSKNLGGKSDAPAVLVVVDKGHGVVDAFWFFFYSYNLGNTVFNVRFGNHVGDWEHTMVRFYKGEAKSVFFSEHSGGEAYTYDAVERFGKRPVAYSATGTHAMYATPGVHNYVLPFGILHDVTDRGPLWDPTLNLHAYTYDYRNDTLRTSTLTPRSPRGWFYFMGHWGDKFYPLSDPRQYRFAGEYHYVNGPLGPRFKNLGRRKVCQWTGDCNIRGYIGEAGLVRRANRIGEGEKHPEEDGTSDLPDDELESLLLKDINPQDRREYEELLKQNAEAEYRR